MTQYAWDDDDTFQPVPLQGTDYAMILRGGVNKKGLLSTLQINTNQIPNLSNSVRSALLTGFQATPIEPIVDTDSILTAFCKSQAQMNAFYGSFAAIGNRNQANGYVGLEGNSRVFIAGNTVIGTTSDSIGATTFRFRVVSDNNVLANLHSNTANAINAFIEFGNPIYNVFLTSTRSTARWYAGLRTTSTTSQQADAFQIGRSNIGADFSILRDGQILLNAPTAAAADSFLSNNQITFYDNSNTLTVKFKASGGAVTNIPLAIIGTKDSPGGFVGIDASNNVTIAGEVLANKFRTNNDLANKKLVLFSTNTDLAGHDYYGLGINSFTMRYQVGNPTAKHVFYANIDATTSRELMSIGGSGEVAIPGALTSGSLITDTVGIKNGGAIYLNNTAQTHFLSFSAPNIAASVNYLFPSDGTAGQVLSTQGNGTLEWVDAGGGGSPSYLQQNFLNLGHTVDSATKTFFTSNFRSSIVFYTSTGNTNAKLFSISQSNSGGLSIAHFADDRSSLVPIFNVVPDGYTIDKDLVILGGYRLHTRSTVNLGNSSGTIIPDSYIDVSGCHYVFDNSNAPSDARAIGMHYNNAGELVFNRLNSSGTIVSVPFKLYRFDSTHTSADFGGKLQAQALNSLTGITGEHILLEGGDTGGISNCYIGLNNYNALAGYKVWAINGNADGSLNIAAYDDQFDDADKSVAINITRTAAVGVPTIDKITRAGGGASFDVVSDINAKVKSSIKSLDERESLSIISSIPVNSFVYKEEQGKKLGCKKGEKKIGTIAQELKNVCSEAVRGEKGSLSVNIDPIFWHLVNSVKALRAEIEHLKTLH